MQWTARRIDFCTLTQRFGRAARDPSTHGIGLLLAEPACFETEEEKERKRKRKEKGKQRQKRPRGHAKEHRAETETQIESQLDAGENDDDDDENDNDDDDDDDDDDGDGDGLAGTIGTVNEDVGGNESGHTPIREEGTGNSHHDPVDLQARWDEYVSWTKNSTRETTENKGFAGYSPPLLDMIRVRKPSLHCHRLASRIYFAPSKELGKVFTFIILCYF